MENGGRCPPSVATLFGLGRLLGRGPKGDLAVERYRVEQDVEPLAVGVCSWSLQVKSATPMRVKKPLSVLPSRTWYAMYAGLADLVFLVSVVITILLGWCC